MACGNVVRSPRFHPRFIDRRSAVIHCERHAKSWPDDELRWMSPSHKGFAASDAVGHITATFTLRQGVVQLLKGIP
jgi:hypothetical protein